MSDRFPYVGIPDYQVWRRAVSDVARGEVDPQAGARFTIDRSTRIASAGSCFAQRIAESLQASGYTYFVAEPGPMWESPEWLRSRHFGAYTARYGDIYTTLQLLQLAKRCVGTFVPSEAPWRVKGRYVDPFRPRVEPDGFADEAALAADRDEHLRAVRRMLVESDVFVFTLGLTEVWCCTQDGAALPLCPGSGGIGTFDGTRYHFRNLTVDENVAYFEEFLAIAWSLNPRLQVILTVSPVPLAATAEPRHVVASTTWSKSVLRVAAEELRRRHEQVEYFASYEMVSSPADGVDAFEPDRRNVKPEAVERVMRSFFGAFAVAPARAGATLADSATLPPLEKDPCDEDFFRNHLDEQRAAERGLKNGPLQAEYQQ